MPTVSATAAWVSPLAFRASVTACASMSGDVIFIFILYRGFSLEYTR
jgi:hypothetical protein